MNKLHLLIINLVLVFTVYSCTTHPSNIHILDDNHTWIKKDSGDIRSIKIIGVKILKESSSMRDLIEFSVDLNNTLQLNPFKSKDIAIDAEFTCPDGSKMKVPAFYTRDYNLKEEGLTEPIVDSDGWRVRFSGKDTGNYTCRLILQIRGNEVQTIEGPSFSLKTKINHGMIRRPSFSSRYMEYEDGTPYFSIGENLAWPTETTKRIFGVWYTREDKSAWKNFSNYWEYVAFHKAPLNVPNYSWDSSYRRWITRLHENGANCIRFWMFNLCYLEGVNPENYNLERAWRMDYILDLATVNDIYMILCFELERCNKPNSEDGNEFFIERGAYCRFLKNKGIEDPSRFLEFDLTSEMSYNRYRYIVGRWGYSKNIFAWELWNEYETVRGDNNLKVEWLKKSTALLRSVDSYHHLVKSPSHKFNRKEYWGEECGDFNDVHAYYGWTAQEMGKDFSEMIIHYSDYVSKEKLPFIHGETGAAREVETAQFGMVGFQTDKDKRQINMHEVLWSGLFSGAIGSGMPWWWDEQVDYPNVYFWFRGLANFAQDVKWTTEDFIVKEPQYYEAMDLRIRRLMGKKTHLIWLQNLNWTWWNVAQGTQPIVPVKESQITIHDVAAGNYEVEFWDTEKGVVMNMTKATSMDSSLKLVIPRIQTDMALKLKRID